MMGLIDSRDLPPRAEEDRSDDATRGGAARRRAPVTPDASQLFLWLAMLVAGTVTMPQVVGFAGTSGLGMWTMGIVFATFVLWTMRPYFPRETMAACLPLTLFVAYASLSMIWNGVLPPSIQILSVSVALLGLVLVSARECERSPAFAVVLHRALDAATLFAAAAYTGVLLKEGLGGDLYLGERPFFLARPFALFACVAVARQLARFQAGERIGLPIALYIAILVFLSQSRTALVIIVGLFPLSYILKGNARSVRAGLLMGVVGGGTLAASVLLYKPMYERFFAYDASLSVGGVSVNATGRTEVWNTLLDDMNGSTIYFGHGIAASSQRTDRINPELGHPHNDFIRYYYDLGLFGLGIFVSFLLSTIWLLAASVRRCVREDCADLPIHLAPLLAMIAFVIAMCTDNPVTYIYLSVPIGLMIGSSVGILSHDRRQREQAATAATARFAWEGRMGWVDDVVDAEVTEVKVPTDHDEA